jgi:hypothetical protein
MKRPTLTSLLRDALWNDPRNWLELSRQTGISHTVLMHFAKEFNSIRLETADTLAEFYGIEHVVQPAKNKGKAK